MGVPVSDGGYDSTPHQGYAREVFDALTRIAVVLPLHSDQQKDSLRASFARVADMLERGANKEHNDFGEVAKALIKIALNQPVLRLAALTTYNALPLAGFGRGDGDTNPVELCEKWSQPDGNITAVRLQALAILKNQVLSEAITPYRYQSPQILTALEKILENPQNQEVDIFLREALRAIDSAQTNALEQSTKTLTLRPA